MQPVLVGDIAPRDLASAQDRLTDIGHEHRMLDIVVGAVTVQQRFQSRTRCLLEQLVVVRIVRWKRLAIGHQRVIYERIDQRTVGVEHQVSLSVFSRV
jgi:hypothetical protein